MKTLLLSLLFATLVWAQSTGTVTQNTTSNVVGTAGTLVCTLTNSTPSLPTGVRVVCTVGGTAALTLDSVVPSGTNGMVGSFGNAGNTITWIVNQPTGQSNFSYQMAANGTPKVGTF